MDNNTHTQIAQRERRIDPVTATIINGALDNIAVEMGFRLMRMSYSSIIRESEDFGAALCDKQGRQLCECRHSTPLQSGPIPGYVQGILRILAERGDEVRPGDVFVHNDPYSGASHAPDIGFCVPIFFNNELVGFSMTTAHHLDIGSCEPGSVGIVKCADAYAEGIRLRAVRVYENGKPIEPVWHMLRDNVRVPDLIIGDMEAQIAACEVGVARYVELLEKYSLETMNRAIEDLFDYSEQLMRSQIEAIPDGQYSDTGYVDGYLDSNDDTLKNLPVVVTVTVEGSELSVDLTGTAPQVEGHAINMPFTGTVDVAVWLTLRSILLDTERFGDIPQNAGLYRPISISAPKGCLANPVFPAPTIARVMPGNILADTLMHALAPVLPRQISAGIANLKAIGFSGMRDGQQWVHIEIFEGSYGGRHGKDGLDSVDTLYANTRNNPIEDIESHVPLRVNRYELRDHSCASGQWRGGIGSIKEVEFLANGFANSEGDGHAHRPWGYDGGQTGLTSNSLFVTRDGESHELPSMMAARPAQAGDKFIAIGGCGGGYGLPHLREPSQVLADVLDGYVTREQARSVYRVAIQGRQIDAQETDNLRR